jgi:hypothetical protein
MNTIPLFSSDLFGWKNGRGVAERSGMPKEPQMIIRPSGDKSHFAVISMRTGAVLAFYPVYDEDAYDGEFQRYEDAFGRFVITIFND